MTHWIKRWTITNLGIGIIVWILFFTISLNQWSYIAQIHLLILFGISILTPMSFRLTIPTDDDDIIQKLARVILLIQPIIPILSVASLLMDISILSGVLAFGWFGQTGLMALYGVIRWWKRPSHQLEELCIDVGLVLSNVSGIWFLFYRLSGEFFGFTGVLVPLTAAHFVTIGMGALIIAGMMGRQLHIMSGLTQIYRGIAWITIISPFIVATGITLTNVMGAISIIEVVGVVMLALSFVALAGYYLITIRASIKQPLANAFLILSAVTLFITMALALGYSLGRFTELFHFSIPDMVQWHGWLNALGFAGLGIIGWNLVTINTDKDST
jgi:hypothetical protein